MARRCSITGKAVLVGNMVSHSNIKTLKRFKPNLQSVSLISDILAQTFRLRITVSTLRSIEVNGGIDKYLTSTSNTKLSLEAISIKKRITKALALNTQI